MELSAVDIGNTSIKIYRFGDDKTGWSCAPKSIAEAIAHCKASGSESVAYCSTRELTAEERRMAQSAGWWEFKYDCRLPIKIWYRTPETLGADRLAAAIGASKLYPGKAVLIADVGTALTLDVVTRRGEYMGGNISPGLQMRFDALHKFTSKLPRVNFDFEHLYFGEDTKTAIQSGVRWGVVNEIAGAFQLACRKYGCDLIVTTGGGAPIVGRDLEEVMRGVAPVKYELTLVQEGLLEAYRYNHDIQN